MTGSGVPQIWRAAPDPSFTKSFTLEVEDHLAVRNAHALPVLRLPYIVTLGVVGLFVGLVYGHGWYRSGAYASLALLCLAATTAGLVAGRLSYGFAASFVRGFWQGFLREREAIGVAVTATAGPNGLDVEVRGQLWSSPWSSLAAIEEDDRLFYFWTSRYQAHVWPKRVFESPEEQAAFRAGIENWTGAPPVCPPRLAGRPAPSY